MVIQSGALTLSVEALGFFETSVTVNTTLRRNIVKDLLLHKSPCENLQSLHLLTYLRTPWCRFLLEKVTGLQLVKKFPAFHRTRRFITALTSVRQLSLSWASPIQSIYPHPTSWRSILILSTHLRLGLPRIFTLKIYLFFFVE